MTLKARMKRVPKMTRESWFFAGLVARKPWAILLSLLVGLCVCHGVRAEADAIAWRKYFSEPGVSLEARSLAVTTQSIFVGGIGESSSARRPFAWIARLTPQGEKIFRTDLSAGVETSSSELRLVGMVPDAAGGLLAVVQVAAGQFHVVKIDAAGREESRGLARLNAPEAWLFSAAAGDKGGILLAGTAKGGALAVSITPKGEVIWERLREAKTSRFSSKPRVNLYAGQRILTGPQFLVVRTTGNATQFHVADAQLEVDRVMPSGQVEPTDVTVEGRNGAVLAAGPSALTLLYDRASDYGVDIRVRKMDSKGRLLWERPVFSGSSPSPGSFRGVHSRTAGAYVVVGTNRFHALDITVVGEDGKERSRYKPGLAEKSRHVEDLAESDGRVLILTSMFSDINANPPLRGFGVLQMKDLRSGMR